MKSYSLLIGSQNSRGRFRRHDEAALREITARHFPAGFTILEASGTWYDPSDARRRKEETREVIVCTAQPRKLGPWCRELGTALRQKEVLAFESGPVRRFAMAPRKEPHHRSAKTK